ncbi:MAG: hypothetical protein WD830_05640 [Chloroflexota bacterium]
MKRHAVSCLTLATALLAAGCSPQVQAPGSPSADQPSSAAGSPPISSNLPAGTETPITFEDPLRFSADETRSAEATVTLADGGTISATATDGTTFVLEVPGQAVAEDTLITVTPLNDVEGLGDGPVHAVQLEPEGLELFEWARLTITPTTPIPVGNQTLFEAAGDGSAPQIGLIDPASASIVLLLEHFSVGGATSLTNTQRAAFLVKSATNAERRINGQIRDRIGAERYSQLTGNSELDGTPGTSDLTDEYKREVVDKLRQAAGISCGNLVLYLRTVISFERQLQLLGLSEADEAASLARVAEATQYAASRYEACEKEAIAQCKGASNPSILVKFWLSNERPADQARAEQLCTQPDYRIDKTVSGSEGGGFVTYTIQYTGTKCGGAAGEWIIDSAGTLTGGGDTALIGGPINVQIDEASGSGPLQGTANFTDVDTGETRTSTGLFTGTGTFDEQGQKLVLDVTGGSGNGYIYGFLDTGISQPGTLTFPLETGDFCD